ncbi:MAG: hypothetical protein U0P30_14210 [Vicinamibacterales bacterium]
MKDSRPGAVEALQREIAVPTRVAVGPAHPQPPSSPRRERASARGWRWVTVAGVAFVVMLSAWAFGPGGYVARNTTPDLTPVATVVSVGGRVEARLGAGASWAPVQRGDVLREGADVPTGSAGALTLVTRDGVEIHVDALSRVDVPDARTVRFQFGSIEVDTRDTDTASAPTALAIALTDLRLAGGPALYTVTRQIRGAEIRVIEGRLTAKDDQVIAAGECRVVMGAGLFADPLQCR